MLDLQPRVHFQKEEALVLAGDEFHRAGAVVADGFGERDRLLAHFPARCFVEQRARRFFQHFLIAALDRTFALAEIDDMAVLVAEHLDFDMARIGDEFLDEDAVVAEARFRFGTGAGKTVRHFVTRMGNAHALAAAAGGGLDHHRIADLVGDLGGLLLVLDDAEIAGHGRNFRRGRGLLAFDLVAHRGDRFGIGPDESDAGLGERHRKGFALGEKAIARMHRFGACGFAGFDDFIDEEIALRRRGRSDQNRLIRHFDMERVAVGLGIDRDGGNPHAPGGLDDPAGDLAAIGNQDSLEHRRL